MKKIIVLGAFSNYLIAYGTIQKSAVEHLKVFLNFYENNFGT